MQVDAADQSCTGHHGVLVHHCLLQVALNLTQQAAIRDAAQNPNGIGAVQICPTVHVLHKRAGDNDNLQEGE